MRNKILAAIVAVIVVLGALSAAPANAAVANKATVTCSAQRVFSVAGPEVSLRPDDTTKIHTLRFIKYRPCYNHQRRMSLYRVLYVEAHFSINKRKFGRVHCAFIRKMKARWKVYSKYGSFKTGVNVPCKASRNEVKRGKSVRYDIYYSSSITSQPWVRHAGRWDLRGAPDTPLRVHNRIM